MDVVAIGAHPDDVELTIGGTVAKLVARGRSVALLDLTRGEMGTRGTPVQRADEAVAAGRMLGVRERITLDMGDGMLADTTDNRIQLIGVLRRLRPRLVLAPHWHDLHPDHCAAGQLVRNVMYPMGFNNYPAEGEAYRPKEFLFFMQHFTFEPTFIVDTSDYNATKLAAIRCYRSQLHDPDNDAPVTLISQPDFIERLEARARHYGSLIHCRCGEPFYCVRPVPMDDPVAHYEPFFDL